MKKKIEAQILRVRRWILTKLLEFKYRNQEATECCCGRTVGDCGNNYGNGCRSMKEYVITSEVNRRLKGK